MSPKILTLSRNGTICNGAILVRRNTILAVGDADTIINKFPAQRIYPLENSVLLPGLINLHTHLELPPLLTDSRAKTYGDWILNLIKAKKRLTLSDYRTAAKQNIQTLMATGTTTVAEICTHNVSPDLLKKSGLRGTIFQEIISMNPAVSNPILPPSSKKGTGNTIRYGLSPHAPYTVSEAMLKTINSISHQHDIPLCMHVAESMDEVKLLARQKSSLEKLYHMAGWDISWAPEADSPFEYLNLLGILSARLLAVHAVQTTDRDISLIRKTRTSIAHCPRSNKTLNLGRMPLKKFLDARIPVGIGTDSLASSPSLNMWDEMRYAYRIHKKNGITAEDILEMATIGGAKALGMDKDIGSLEAGKKADIIAVPLPRKNTGDLHSDLLRDTESSIMTMVNGKILFHTSSTLSVQGSK